MTFWGRGKMRDIRCYLDYGMIATVVGADALALLHIISPILALTAVSAVGGVAALIDHFGH